MVLKSVRVTTRVSEDLAQQVRIIAQEERRSISSVVGQSVELLDIVPSEFRNAIVELNASGNDAVLAEIRVTLSAMAKRYRSQLT